MATTDTGRRAISNTNSNTSAHTASAQMVLIGPADKCLLMSVSCLSRKGGLMLFAADTLPEKPSVSRFLWPSPRDVFYHSIPPQISSGTPCLLWCSEGASVSSLSCSITAGYIPGLSYINVQHIPPSANFIRSDGKKKKKRHPFLEIKFDFFRFFFFFFTFYLLRWNKVFWCVFDVGDLKACS